MFYTVTKPDKMLRTITLVYGLLLFIWLTPEDNSVGMVAVLGVSATMLALLWTVRRQLGGRAVPAAYLPVAGILLGMMVGVGSTLAAAGLMFFKNALHAHAFWDYPPQMVVAMLNRAPQWAAAGALAGLGLSLLWVWKASRPDTNSEG